MKLQEIPYWLDKGFINDKLGQGLHQGVVAIEMNCEKKYYSEAQMDWPLILTRTTHHMGTRSITHKSVLHRQGVALCTSLITTVIIDAKSGKSLPLPELLRNAFKADTNNEKPSAMPRLKLPPSGQYHSWPVRVAHTDIDFNQHLNTSAYVRYCIDCGTDASVKGFLRNLRTSDGLPKIARVKLEYLAESRGGDRLDVCAWEHPEHTDALQFIILNCDNGDSPVFRCILCFHDDFKSNL